MKKYLILIIVIAIATSCSIFNSLTSTTTIKPHDAFVLGKNEHGSFKAKVTNLSKQTLIVYYAPLNGGKYNESQLAAGQTVTLKVTSNTGLVIENNSNDTVDVGLFVNGDTGLSMKYKN